MPFTTTATVRELTKVVWMSSAFGQTTEFQISVALPLGYRSRESTSPLSGPRYPVIYVLDPEPVLFSTVVAASRSLVFYSSKQPDKFRESIIVGVGYPRETGKGLLDYFTIIPELDVPVRSDSDAADVLVGIHVADEAIEQYWQRIRGMRARDYLPTAGNSTAYSSAGHGAEFLQFVADQLVPWVDISYPVRVLHGSAPNHQA
eukprot:617255-Prorocentrum_minimum.AAC.4